MGPITAVDVLGVPCILPSLFTGLTAGILDPDSRNACLWPVKRRIRTLMACNEVLTA